MAEGSVKLTPFAKIFVAVVVLGVIGFTSWFWFKDDIRCWSSPDAEGCGGTAEGTDGGEGPANGTQVGAEDFAGLAGAPADPDRNAPHNVQAAQVGAGRLNRPLRVGINTWAGHAPGIVANGGLAAGNANSIYMRAHNLQVELVIMDDPAAKLTAFQAGEIDIMWDTVDSWAREAAVLAANNKRGRAIIMEDWSRGGDGIAATAQIRSVEDLAGKRIATTQYTPSHWLLLYLISQSGLTPEQRREVEDNLVFAAEAPAAAAMFRAGRVDAAVTWEPDLSTSVEGRGQGAHVLVSTTAATNVIADVLVARQEVIDQAPATLAAFVAGWFEGIEAMRSNPQGTNAVIGDALNLDEETVSGMLSGLKLTPFADNAQFFGLTGAGEGHYATLFATAHRIWRRKGVINQSVRAPDTVETRFVAALADQYRGQAVVEPTVQAAPPSEADTPIINRQLSIHFTPGSADIMPGSFFTLDALGETMTSFGGTVLRIEGNTDSTGSRNTNIVLSQQRADAVRAYLVENHGLPAERIQTIGRGPDNPIADNSNEAGRQLNRRTDIRVILAASAAPAE